MADSPKVKGDDVIRLTIISNGKKIDSTYRVISVTTLKKINKISSAKIVLEDGDIANADFPISNKDDFKPGTGITINAGYGHSEETIFKGIIIKHGIKITGNNFARLIIECRDEAVKMTVGRKNANYVDLKDSDIIDNLIGKYSRLSSDIESTKTTYKELVQYYCTDWDYMLTRAEVNGLLVIVDDAKITVKSPQTSLPAQLEVTYGDDLIEFHGEIDARTQFASVKGATWELTNQQVVEQTASSPQINKQGNITSQELAQVVDLQSYNLQTSAPLEKTGLKSWADAQMVKSALAKIRGTMKFQGSAKAKPGELIELKGVGNRFNGNVLVSSVTHEISLGNWLTEVEFGLSPQWFSEKEDIITPPASGFLPGIEGLQVGVVMKLDEDPEGQYKIQVSVPILQAEKEGVWARLANFYASNQFGSFFIPEIGDEVVLGYFNNDPCNPVILGSLYSSKNKPPYELTSDNFIKAIVTRSKLKIEFDDEKKITTLVTPGNNKIVISDDDKSILLEDQNNNKIQMNPSGIILDSPKDISMTAKGKFTVNAAGNITVISKVDVTLSGQNINNNANMSFKAKGNISSELSSSAQTIVKGTIVKIN